MGKVRSKIQNSPKKVNGVALGEPAIVKGDGSLAGPGDNIADCYFAWDDGALADGEIDAKGKFIADVKGMP